jgi:hypothetical protein
VDPAPRLAQPVDVVIILRGLSAGDRHILPGRRRAAGLPCSAVPARRAAVLAAATERSAVPARDVAIFAMG